MMVVEDSMNPLVGLTPSAMADPVIDSTPTESPGVDSEDSGEIESHKKEETFSIGQLMPSGKDLSHVNRNESSLAADMFSSRLTYTKYYN
jgi:hypothetical protein